MSFCIVLLTYDLLLLKSV